MASFNLPINQPKSSIVPADFDKRAPVVAGRAIVLVLQDHFERLNQQRHQHGVTGFYEEAARGTYYTEEFGYPAVAVNKLGIRLRLYGTAGLPGGVLTPTGGRKYLTIPARSEAYGRRATDIIGLRLQYGRQKDGDIGPVALVGDKLGVEVLKDSRGKGKWKKVSRSTNMVYFWLCESVQQDADPSVVPPEQKLQEAGAAAIAEWMKMFGFN